MKPHLFLRFFSNHWNLVHKIWDSFESRTFNEADLIRAIKPLLDPSVLPHEKIQDLVNQAVLSEYKRGGRGFSINAQLIPTIQFLLNEQKLGLIAEISLNAEHLKVHLKGIEDAIHSGKRTSFFQKSQDMQDRFQSLLRMVDSNTQAIYRLVDQAKQTGNSIPLLERYASVIQAWDEYITPALEMKSIDHPFDQTMSLVRGSIQTWLSDQGLHLLSTDDTRSELENILFRMLDFKDKLDRSVGTMSRHLYPLVHKARISTQIAQGAALCFREITKPESVFSKDQTLRLPEKKRQVRKPDEDSLTSFYADLVNFDSAVVKTPIKVTASIASRVTREKRDDILEMITWIKRQRPLEDIFKALMAQYPNAKPSSITKVYSKLSADNKIRVLIKRHDDDQEYHFENLIIRMKRRSLENAPVARPKPPSADRSAVALQ